MEKFIRKNRSKLRSGFTIIELLIYITIVTVVVTVLTNFIIDVTKTASSSRAAKEVQQNTRLVMSKIMRDVRRADSVTFLDAGKQLELSIIENPGDPPVIVGFYLADLSNDSTNCNIDDICNIYFYTGSRPGTPVPADAISTGDIKVTDLNFSPLNDSVIIDLTARPANDIAGSGPPYSLTSTFVLRKNVY